MYILLNIVIYNDLQIIYLPFIYSFNLHSNFHLEDLINHLPQQVTGAELYGLCQNAWLNRIRKIIHQRHKNGKNVV